MVLTDKQIAKRAEIMRELVAGLMEGGGEGDARREPMSEAEAVATLKSILEDPSKTVALNALAAALA